MSIVMRGGGGKTKENNLKGVMIVLKASKLLWVGFPKRVVQGDERGGERTFCDRFWDKALRYFF
jgi:hypothetical protein